MDASRKTLDWVVAPAARVTGLVLDSRGEPAASVVVNLLRLEDWLRVPFPDDSWFRHARVKTDERGEFQVTCAALGGRDLPWGRYLVRAHQGPSRKFFSGTVARSVVEIPPGEHTATVVLRLVRR